MNDLKEFERMIGMEQRLLKKQELSAETIMLNSLINETDTMIEIYSTIDFIRVGELLSTRVSLMNSLLDVLSESNDLYLSAIASSNKTA
jgi:hypothetical protein